MGSQSRARSLDKSPCLALHHSGDGVDGDNVSAGRGLLTRVDDLAAEPALARLPPAARACAVTCYEAGRPAEAAGAIEVSAAPLRRHDARRSFGRVVRGSPAWPFRSPTPSGVARTSGILTNVVLTCTKGVRRRPVVAHRRSRLSHQRCHQTRTTEIP